MWYSFPFYCVSYDFSIIMYTNCNAFSIPFFMESVLTSFVSPMVVFYSIFNEAHLPSENIPPIELKVRIHEIQITVNLRVLFYIESIEFNIYFSYLRMKTTECYRQGKGQEMLYSVCIL